MPLTPFIVGDKFGVTNANKLRVMRNYSGYHEMDDQSPLYILCYVPSGFNTGTLKLRCFAFPEYHYTELAQHDHPNSLAAGGHTHTWGNWTSSNTDTFATSYDYNHIHFNVTTGGSSTGGSDGHNHTGTTAGHQHYVDGTTGAAGSTTAGNAGIAGAYLNDTKKVAVDDLLNIYFSIDPTVGWGTARTKASTGMGNLVNINTGAGADLTITTYLTANTFNFIKIEEPTAKKGGGICWDLEID